MRLSTQARNRGIRELVKLQQPCFSILVFVSGYYSLTILMTVLTLTCIALLCVVGITIFKTVTQSHASPLNQIPNAGWGAGYSRLAWAFRQEYCGSISLRLPKIHEHLGPLVRIGPKEVSFYSLDVYDLVHRVNSGFVKDPRNYGEFVQDGHPALFSITDPDEHTKRRRILGQLFSRSRIVNLEGLMLHHVDEFVKAVSQREHPFDIGPACRALEADIISEFSFGEALHAISGWSNDCEIPIVSKNDQKATFMPLLMNFPVLYDLWLALEDVLCYFQGSKISSRKGLQQYDQWTRNAWVKNKDPGKKSAFPNLINVMVSAGVPTQTALSEAKENLGPGTDTTSASLAHILFALSRNPTYQEKLYQDLANQGFPTDMGSLENIPRLKACVKEGIRWAGAAAAMLPRVVPPGGVELCGKFIPEGTVITSSPIWYLRDRYAYPNPELFDPYRWIDETGTFMTSNPLRDKFYIPFSKGSNVCIGNHFSYFELFLALAKMVENFEIVHVNKDGYGQVAGPNNSDWQPVQLPKRKEWVAAVVTQPLLVKTVPRVRR
ncbi:benzoate 4-monooxygenase cytochrome p450 [Colletotrichum zoysiae]|uniref:Benzoate 4-monooxygenase cytochrome p450 n=1 Tax=Colletotrichum zoysiae TaxID=1216348 RepID=A0AAD9HI39_9PEZI|nr:benzoate 4-monooxygenase cytochrome p450 [Colletotrichum zoysiae]